eukprot:TRINITY_DN15295_c0_g1_i1.p1 TRINITY_DN15295_c0_g1~~TRINITY_DN15295_c0_g1_i1.p1  ORF type:complete len:151 (-),score=19.84 TRINITY_DN15295_c0_g1_i1:18-470(-)
MKSCRCSLLFLAVVCGCVVGLAAASPCDNLTASRATQCEALVRLYSVTGGAAAWTTHTNWLSTTAGYCHWYGVTCNETSFDVIGFDGLHNNGGVGTIPSELSSLKQLGTLQVAYAPLLSGTIPSALSSLCLLYTSPSPRDRTRSRMPSSA